MDEQGAEAALELTLLCEEWEISPDSLQLLPAVSLHHTHLPPCPRQPFFQEDLINTYVLQNTNGQVMKWMHQNNCMGITEKNVVVSRALSFCTLVKYKCKDKLQNVSDAACWAQKSRKGAFEAKQ